MSGRSASEVRALLVQSGMLLESARGPIVSVAELVAGEPIRGSWWGHADGHAIFNIINELADAPDVVRLRLVGDKITLVHARLWPALARLADQIPAKAREILAEVATGKLGAGGKFGRVSAGSSSARPAAARCRVWSRHDHRRPREAGRAGRHYRHRRRCGSHR